jgi:hypothetical protein
MARLQVVVVQPEAPMLTMFGKKIKDIESLGHRVLILKYPVTTRSFNS